MSTFPRYTHLPLPSPHHIRLLEFPAYTDRRESLQGTIRVIDIEESTVPYVALSYTWGQSDSTKDLFLDGNGIFGITPTLAAALRRFRYSSALRWIWVDAICINQQDDAEKTFQIPLMGNIYRGASRVLIWLGDRAQDIELLHQIRRLVRKTIDPCEDYADRLVTSLSQLGRLPWFGRRWIIQELVLNPNAVLCCGEIELPWLHLVPAFQAIGNKKTTDLQNIRLLWDLWRDITMWAGTRNKDQDLEALGKRDIAALLNSCSEFECRDGHDRIAALLGLSTDSWRAERVNYAVPVEQTFIRFAEGLARSGHMAWLIYQSLQRKNEPSNQGQILPSWVPDWRAPILRHDQNSKLDTEVYKRIPCDIQMHSASPSLHLLTAKFSILLDRNTASDDSMAVPVNVDPAPLKVAWKSVLFSKEADIAERMALTLMDLWPWVVAHLSGHEMAFKHDIWFELLLWLSLYLMYPPQFRFYHRQLIFEPNFKRPVMPDFGQDTNGLDTLRSFTRYWVMNIPWSSKVMERSEEDLARIDCLILCRQTSQSGVFTRGLPCSIGSLQLPFYHAVEIGDAVLTADLGSFHFAYDDGSLAQHDTRHIVREHAAVLPGVKSPDSHRGANQCVSPEGLSGLSKAHSSQKIALPVVYEFMAPCDLFGLFPWRGLYQ